MMHNTVKVQQAPIGRLATQALLAEVNLPHKPGLVGPDGSRGHQDMDIELMRKSAKVLEPTFSELTEAGKTIELGQELRDEIGKIGRRGEATMMNATGGVNTHRGAIWNVGLLVTAASGLMTQEDQPFTAFSITQRAGSLASIPDSFIDSSPRPGATARKKYKVGGAVSEAASGFPHVIAILQAMGFYAGNFTPSRELQIKGLITCMSSLDDTCILHRGGAEALAFVHGWATDLLVESPPNEGLDVKKLSAFDQHLTNRNLSPGGSADLLAGALFLTSIFGESHANH
ncbi:hypothetical protein A583_01277 [Corynebacterium glutamicum Z188]|nr:triphosphoribosyl-dephospho-CoA synthase [Corynebacterium glutamicum]AGN17936.1 hypothetical protein C624_01735 [Corynebacterium glutamicum SCgG1]EPP41924.1 hypothetical protein A583_01277 [Corynebacterium glutamicum Z188]NII88599.1 triphosphoribosyl-dephospho-CoA synthase [Corynebacterium glutamicum]